MRLNGIHAEPGTVIGVDYRSERFVVADVCDTSDALARRQPLRHATDDEVTPKAFMHEPRSVTEHRSIRRRMTPYGLVRQFKPIPTRPVKLEMEMPTGRNLSRVDRRALIRKMRRNMLR